MTATQTASSLAAPKTMSKYSGRFFEEGHPISGADAGGAEGVRGPGRPFVQLPGADGPAFEGEGRVVEVAVVADDVDDRRDHHRARAQMRPALASTSAKRASASAFSFGMWRVGNRSSVAL